MNDKVRQHNYERLLEKLMKEPAQMDEQELWWLKREIELNLDYAKKKDLDSLEIKEQFEEILYRISEMLYMKRKHRPGKDGVL